LTNTSAEYKYSYGGKTWFFRPKRIYRFRNAPEQFAPGVAKEE
jgi:YHS domain-containing protein